MTHKICDVYANVICYIDRQLVKFFLELMFRVSDPHAKYVAMTNPEQIKESSILTVDIEGHATKALQWVFYTGRAEEGFEKECKGKFWIHEIGGLMVPKDLKKAGRWKRLASV